MSNIKDKNTIHLNYFSKDYWIVNNYWDKFTRNKVKKIRRFVYKNSLGRKKVKEKVSKRFIERKKRVDHLRIYVRL